MNKNMLYVYLRLFIIVPFLLFSGFSITTNRYPTNSTFFHVMVFLTFLTIFFFHVKHLIKLFYNVFDIREYEKDFGVFLLMLAVFQFAVCIHDIYSSYHHKKNKSSS